MKKITLILFALLGLLNQNIFSQEVGTSYTPVVSQAAYFDVSMPIKDIAIPPQGAKSHHQWKNNVVENKFKDKNFKKEGLPLINGDDLSLQKEYGTKGITVPIQNFEGTRNSDNGISTEWVSPPDTDGDVGPNHYFQMCNVIFQIFDKSGTSLLGPLDNSTIWDGFVGAWTGTNDGDPIILYDEQADRWLVSQFAVNTTNGTYWELVAISTTGDPTGSYYRYAFQFTSFPDYPKFGIWRDGYYIMVQHGTAAGAVTAASFNRSQMIAGNPTAQMVSFAMPSLPGGGFIGMLPSDNDGAWAPLGTPNYFVYFSDDAWGDDPVDRLKIWEFTVNWTTPALSTLVLTTNLNTNAFDSNFGSFFSGWITQPGTTQKLATLEGALMNRLQYRNFGSYQSMVCCHTIDVNGSNRAGVRWYELRRTTGAWSIYQQGTYSPGTTDNYWMASIAQNGDGDIALGFSVSSSATYPSIKYTGRNAGDPLGVMTLTEQSIWAGTVSQSGTHRWGDYSMMSVDPTDDKTFWYTNEYINSSAWSDWVTRIASFSLGNYCAAGGGCEEYIYNVSIGTINNTSGCSGYADYTAISTNILLSETKSLTVTNGAPWAADQCGAWVDWNNDGDFSDANEAIAVSGNPGNGPYTASITPPAGTSIGLKTMRVRITYTGAVDPCGTTPYGEVEDYSLNVIPYCEASGGCDEYISRVQFGTIDNITGCSGYANYTGISTNLGLTATKTLTVTNGTPIYYPDQCGVWVDWNRDNDFYDANESITVAGTPGIGPYTASITPPSGTISGPVRMRIRITYTDILDPCGFNTYGEVEDYTINLIGPNHWVGGFNHYWHQPANWSAGHIPTEDEDVVINNVGYQPVYVDNYPGTPNEACYNLIIGTGASVQVWDMILNVNGHMHISGALSMTDATGVINVKQNWHNWVGAGGFTAGPGKVVFNGGAYHQYCMSETFNILEVNKASGGAFRPYNGHNIVCAAYDWTAGAVDVIEGSFTANDLLDNGIYGAFYCNPLGTINLNNLSGNTWVDLNGEMHIYGGTVNVSGSVSDWPYAANALIEMTDGVLDFKTCGISINASSFTLTNNISGGIIRTANGFSSNRADFTPTAGTIELYGASDAGIYQLNGSTFWDVNINKSAKNESIGEPILPVSGERIDQTAGKGGKANSVTPFSNISITNSLTISSGTFEVGGYTCSVTKSLYVYGTLSMTNSAGVLNVGTSQFDWLYFFPGSFGNLSAGNINLPYALIINNGALVSSTAGNSINFGTTFDFGGIANYDPNTSLGNVNVNMNGGKWILDPTNTGPIEVNGNFNIFPGNTVEMFNNSLLIHGLLTDTPTSAIYCYDGPVADGGNSLMENDTIAANESMGAKAKGGLLEIDTDFTLNGLMDVGDGSVLLHGIFHLASTGNLNITSGSFIADAPLHAKGWEYIDGHLGLTSGLFEISHNSINFSVTGTSTVSGGIIRSGEAFAAQTAGNFQPSGGTVEIVGLGSNTIYCNNSNYFYNLLINRDPAALSVIQTNIQVNNNLTVNSGTLHVGWSSVGYTASVLGGVILNGGNLSVNSSSNLLLAGSTTLNVNSGGKLSVIGGAGVPGRISRISTGYYGLNVNSGGAIAAQYGTFEYMSTNGVNLLAGSIVDPVYSFHNCTFQNGQAGGRLMTVENNQVFNVENAVFPTNTWSGSYNVYKSANVGTVNFVTATGGFAGESFDYDPNNRVNWTGRMLSLKAYMEGPFNGTNMNTTLNGILPLNHPFNVTLPYFGGTPKWYYTGAGSVGAIPNANIVDWVLLDIRDAANAAAATGATSVAKIPAFILNNGNIVALDGTSSPQISNAIVNNLFVVIYSRNHEGIMNANLIPYSAGLYTYDYTTGASQVLGGTAGHKELSAGKWGMRSGDGNGDGSVTTFDKTNVWGLPTQLGKTGYLPSDFSFDRQTNNKDKNDKWKPNLGTSSQVPN